MQVLLVLGERQTVDTGCSPWINVTIDIYHLRIVLGQEVDSMIVKRRRELHILSTLWYHQSLQISLSRLDAEIFLERFGIIAIISQLSCSLHVKRSGSIIIGEIAWLTHIDPVIKHLLVIRITCRNLIDILTPLPESKSIFKYREVENLCQWSIKDILLLIAILLEHWQQGCLALKEKQLEIEHLLSVRKRLRVYTIVVFSFVRTFAPSF